MGEHSSVWDFIDNHVESLVDKPPATNPFLETEREALFEKILQKFKPWMNINALGNDHIEIEFDLDKGTAKVLTQKEDWLS